MMCVNVYLINFKYEMRMKALTRPPIGLRVTLRIRFIKLRKSFVPSFPIHRESPLGTQMRFRLAGRNDRRLKDEGTDPPPDRVEGDVKDKVYQTAGISSILSFQIHRESPLGTQMRFRLAGRNDKACTSHV